MQRPITTSIPLLSQPSEEAHSTEADLAVAQDLKDTLDAHRNGCVGMAANMIGEHKRIIAFVDEELGGRITLMFNPRITAQDGAYDTAKDACHLTASAARCAISVSKWITWIAAGASGMPRSLVSPRRSSSMRSIIAKALSFKALALSFNDFFKHGT